VIFDSPNPDWDDVAFKREVEQKAEEAEYDVARALMANGHDVLMIGIGDDVSPLLQKLGGFQPKLVFNGCEGFRKNARHEYAIAALLDMYGYRYTGSSPTALLVARNKSLTKKVLAFHGIRVPAFAEFHEDDDLVRPSELRFPLIEAALTPVGVIGGIRGVFFANIGGAWFNNQPSADTGCTGSGGYKFATSATETCRLVTGALVNATNTDFVRDPSGNAVLTYGPPRTIEGFRLKDGRASYGVGLETFALGFPIHFDWSWRTTFNKAWEDVVYAGQNGCNINGDGCSAAWRKPRFAVWIGYDF